MTNIDMNADREPVDAELTLDDLELVSGGGDLGPAAKIEAPAPKTLGDIARFVFTGS